MPAVDLPSFAPQQCVTLAHFLKEVRANVIVPKRPYLHAVGGTTFGIFFFATKRLFDIIQRYKL